MLKYLISPTNKVLTFYVILIIPIIWKLIFITSFSWIPPVEFLILIGLLIFCGLFYLMMFIDIKYRTRIRKYFSLPCYVVVALLFIWYPYKSQLIKKSEQKGNQIVSKIELFKTIYNQYPPDLNLQFFKSLNLETPIGTKFEYSLNAESNRYNLRFYSFNGTTGSFYNGHWHYDD